MLRFVRIVKFGAAVMAAVLLAIGWARRRFDIPDTV